MELLVTLVIWAGLAFLMMRFGCGAHAGGHGAHHDGEVDGTGPSRPSTYRWTPPEKVVDPVCGETVRPTTAKPTVHDGRVYYFCSRDCREIFEAAPDLYLAGDGQRQREAEHSHA